MKFPDPELLVVLIAFEESKNLVAAAERLQISQPAVSQRLQRLQDQVPVPLFAFQGRKKVLTHYGRALYDLAKENWRALEHGYETLNRRYATASHLVLRLGGRSEIFRFFSDLVRFSGRLDLRQMDEAEALAALQAESIDVALTSTTCGVPEFESRKIFESTCRLAFHRKLFSTIETFRDLQRFSDLVLKTPNVSNRLDPSPVERFCRALKIQPNQLNNRALLEDWSAIVAFLESGGGFAILPAFVQTHSVDIRTIDIPHAVIPRTSYYAVYARKLKRIDAFKEALSFNVWSS